MKKRKIILGSGAALCLVMVLYIVMHTILNYVYMNPFVRNASEDGEGWYSQTIDEFQIKVHTFKWNEFYGLVEIERVGANVLQYDEDAGVIRSKFSICMFIWTGPFKKELGLYCTEVQDSGDLYYYLIKINDDLEYIPDQEYDDVYNEFVEKLLSENKDEINRLYAVYQSLENAQ